MKIRVKNTVGKALAVGAGAIAASAVDSALPSVDPKMLGAGKLLLGAFGPQFFGKNQMLADACNGIMAVGAVQLTHAFFPDMVPGIAGLIAPTISGMDGDDTRVIVQYTQICK